jgi:hypothetical protein
MRNTITSEATAGDRRRTCAKLIRYTANELRAVAERAQAAGRPVACYIREASLGTTPRARHSPMSDALVRQLVQLGNQLTTLAREARDRQLPQAPDFDAGLHAVLETIRQLGVETQ